jgi:uncharacterized protein (DUF3820 family)
MPIGKYRGHLIRDLPECDDAYADWLLAQPWFRQRYPDEALALARAAEIWRDPKQRELAIAERRRAFERREAERVARCEQQEQEWLDRHVVKYDPPGIWPLGKYKGQPLAMVVRDDAYCTWFKGSAYARMNPELVADLKLAQQSAAAGKSAIAVVEICDGGCNVYWLAAWCSHARH